MSLEEMFAFRVGFFLCTLNVLACVVALLEPSPWSFVGWTGEAFIGFATLSALIGAAGGGVSARGGLSCQAGVAPRADSEPKP